MKFNIKSIQLPRRLKLEYVEHGARNGVPVILLHGITDSWRSFELVLPHLPKSVRAFALSQRGHGDSERPASDYSPRDFADDVAAFMDALELPRAVIVGHSMGSYVAQCFAMNYPERTQKLVLVGSFTTLQGNSGVQEFWDTGISKLEDPIDPNFALEFQKSTLAQPIPAGYLETVVRESMKLPARVWRAAFQDLMQANLFNELDKIIAPALIIWGDQDTYFLREEQDALAARIADAKLVVYNGAGHALHWEEPQRFAADLLAFIEKR